MTSHVTGKKISPKFTTQNINRSSAQFSQLTSWHDGYNLDARRVLCGFNSPPCQVFSILIFLISDLPRPMNGQRHTMTGQTRRQRHKTRKTKSYFFFSYFFINPTKTKPQLFIPPHQTNPSLLSPLSGWGIRNIFLLYLAERELYTGFSN